MADGTLGGLGSSIGLTATPREYTSLYKYSQQLRAQQEKAKQDKLDDIIKNVTVKAGENLHRLEVEPMRIRTAEFIDRARQYVGQDDMSGFYQELTNYQADLNMAKNRSKGYWDLEKTVKDAAAGNKYVPKNVRQAAGLMLNSATSADYINAMNENGIKRNAFFDYDDQGNVMTQSFDAYDINKAVKDLIAGNSVVIGRGKEVFDPYTKTKKQPYIKGIPYDDNQAAGVRNMIDENGFMVQPTLTAKEIPGKLLSNTALAAQYIDMYDLEDMTPDQIEQHFMETVVDPNIKLKEGVQTTKKSGDINITNTQGTAANYAFIGEAKKKLNFMEEGKLAQIDSQYSVQLAPGGEFIFQITPSGAMISKEDNVAYSLTQSSDLKANYIHVLPYREVNGVKYVISEAAAKKIYKGKVKYAPFVEGKMMDFTVQPNVTNADYYTEFTADILGGFANDAATKGKQASAAFAEGIRQLNKKLVSLGARPVGVVR